MGHGIGQLFSGLQPMEKIPTTFTVTTQLIQVCPLSSTTKKPIASIANKKQPFLCWWDQPKSSSITKSHAHRHRSKDAITSPPWPIMDTLLMMLFFCNGKNSNKNRWNYTILLDHPILKNPWNPETQYVCWLMLLLLAGWISRCVYPFF